jgi:hypothetical protein
VSCETKFMRAMTATITVRTAPTTVKSRVCSSQKCLTLETIVPGTRHDRIRPGYGGRLPQSTDPSGYGGSTAGCAPSNRRRMQPGPVLLSTPRKQEDSFDRAKADQPDSCRHE